MKPAIEVAVQWSPRLTDIVADSVEVGKMCVVYHAPKDRRGVEHAEWLVGVFGSPTEDFISVGGRKLKKSTCKVGSAKQNRAIAAWCRERQAAQQELTERRERDFNAFTAAIQRAAAAERGLRRLAAERAALAELTPSAEL
jgi:hypothetical protein